MTDLHTHTFFSPDGNCQAEDLIKLAISKNMHYLGISDHVNFDCLHYGLDEGRFDKSYFPTLFSLKEKYKDKINVLVGIECGFLKNKKVNSMYKELIEEFKPDYVINSVHMSGKSDYYFYEYKDKKSTYINYLKTIYNSLKCEYPYDIAAHIGYVMRYAPYEDKTMPYGEFKEQYDVILDYLIKNDKILEINSSCKLGYTDFLPSADIVEAYFKRGGRKISFGSDTHSLERLMEKRDKAVAMLKNIGFDHLTIPDKSKHIEFDL